MWFAQQDIARAPSPQISAHPFVANAINERIGFSGWRNAQLNLEERREAFVLPQRTCALTDLRIKLDNTLLHPFIQGFQSERRLTGRKPRFEVAGRDMVFHQSSKTA
jgi:hypothetical protein